MERLALKKSLDFLLCKLQIVELTTDASLSIIAMIGKAKLLAAYIGMYCIYMYSYTISLYTYVQLVNIQQSFTHLMYGIKPKN